MTDPEPDTLPITVRVFAVRARRPEPPDGAELQPPRTRRATRRRLPPETLVFDTETAHEPAMRLNVGCWRLYRDRPGVPVPKVCIEEGLFYADDLPLRDP